MSNYDGASKALDNLRTLIIRDDSGLAPVDIVMLGHVAGWLEHVEMSLRHEQSKHIVKDTRKGEWPEEGQDFLMWDAELKDWEVDVFIEGKTIMLSSFWLPAPPPPTDD